MRIATFASLFMTLATSTTVGLAQDGAIELDARIAAADLELGAEAFETCASCHAYERGEPAMIGPNLRGVVGREIAGESDFDYSPAMRSLNGRWDREQLDRFLASPKTYAPGTAMNSAGVRDPAERAAVIAYLETLEP
jgi:cytochrome c